MAIVRKKGNIFHIQWFDPILKKRQSKSTGLKVTPGNEKKAKQYAKLLQEEITKKSRKNKQLGGNEITIQEAFEHFLKNNQFKNPKTIKCYHWFYRKFTETFEGESGCSELNKLVVEDWLIKIKKMPCAQNTIHGYGKQLNHFLNFLFEYNYTEMFKINKEVKTRAEVKEKIVFSDIDLIEIFARLENKNSNFRTLIHLLFYTGLRSSDLINIDREKIDLKNHVLNYYSPKRKKYRSVPFHMDLTSILSERIKETSGNFLLNYKNVENITLAISRYFNIIALNGKGYSARTFRKTFITLCRSRYNMDASIVRELVGHEQRNTTDRYYNQISISIMKEELTKFSRPHN